MRAPTSHEFWRAQRSLLYVLRWPTFWVTGELLYDCPELPLFLAWWYARAYHDYDRDQVLFALTPLAWGLRVWYAWQNSAARFCVERAMRERIADKPEGERWTHWTWKFRAPRDWTWKPTRSKVRKPPIGSKPQWLD